MGGAYKPFDPSNKDNLTPRVDIERFTNRNELLKSLEGVIISGSSADSVTKFNNQAFDVILGTAKDAFDLDKEDEKVKVGTPDP